MPRFLTLIKLDETAAAAPRSPAFAERMGTLFEEISKAGVMLDTAGLAPTAEGVRVVWSGGGLTDTEGPFGGGDAILGYSMIQAGDRAEAVEWVRRFLAAHDDHLTITAEVREVREFDGA
ncbi:YciI family protein [Streptomyces uncialis]|uniref:YciI family protein n=1 Tax=Streptomyces uncialis TaxID=1048205 RepID=UPI00224DD0E1|nr:YciI family protein [Streptomyces uncialis]MCX4662589.1 YciI family protein [Streptomyces uncialis]WTE09810.1 YciI family protein [Streptomyces uncialis]